MTAQRLVPPLRASPLARRTPLGARWTLWLGVSITVIGLLSVLPMGSGGANRPGPHPGTAVPTAPIASAGSFRAPTNAQIWSNVQVAFVLETTVYDGVYDPGAGDPGYDICAASSSTTPCEESNGVPLFAARAGQVAHAIVTAHPGTNVTFGLADFFSTGASMDDGDGSMFNVDVQNFTSSASFQGAVNNSFRAKVLYGGSTYPDSDLSDNILHSSSITALYGALGTQGFNWSVSAHHVIVLIGSTAPQAIGYAVNYSGSASDYRSFCGSTCLSPTCEPAYSYSTTVASPACEGWTVAQNGNATDSLAWLAQNGTLCASSLGANCTVDTIALFNGVTDPASKQWRTPNSPLAQLDSGRILNASCALAAATGGSWDGPSFFTCPNGRTGNLSYVAIGSSTHQNTSNPSLFAALANVSLGAPARGHPGFDQPGDLLIADRLNNRVIEVNPLNDKVVWSFGSGNASLCNPGARAAIAPSDAERLPHGLTLIAATGSAACPDSRVIVVSEAGRVLWQYGRAGVTGSTPGLLNGPASAVQLPNHDILIADRGNNRIVEVDLSGTIVRSFGPTSGPGTLHGPDSVERLANGHWLIADENHNRTIEVDRGGLIVWHYGKGLAGVAFASRLTTGETLIADSLHNRVIAINASGHVVLRFSTNGGPGSNANPNPTRVVELRNGDLLIADQFNDRIIEVNASLQIVFQYGMTNAPGAAFDQTNGPSSAYAIGDYTGLTTPPARFL